MKIDIILETNELAWPNGLQERFSQSVAFVIDGDREPIGAAVEAA